MKSRKTIEQDLQEILVASKIRLYCFLCTIGKITLEEAVRVIMFEINKVREETIRAVEERLPKAQKINKKDWLGLNYTLGDVKYREHQYSLLVLDILNKLKK